MNKNTNYINKFCLSVYAEKLWSFSKFVVTIFFLLYFINNPIVKAVAQQKYVRLEEQRIEPISCPKKLRKLRYSLMKSGISMPKSFEDKILKFLNKNTNYLIQNLSRPQPANCYFLKPSFLREDLLYVGYEDGNDYLGEILVKLTFSEEYGVKAEVLWDSRGVGTPLV